MKNKKTTAEAFNDLGKAVEKFKQEVKKQFKKDLNRLAVWLYKKTRSEEEHKGILHQVNGIKLIESQYMQKGTAVMGTSDKTALEKYVLDREITIKK